MIIAITGHRPQHLVNYPNAEERIKSFFKKQFEDLKPTAVISGMALGVDQYAAEVAISAGVSLTAAVPYNTQAKMWKEDQVERYLDILAKSFRIEVVCSDPATKWQAAAFLQTRNKWMVDNCGTVLAVYDGSPGGTSNCIKYAIKRKTPVICLDPRSWQITTLPSGQ